jgi:transposase
MTVRPSAEGFGAWDQAVYPEAEERSAEAGAEARQRWVVERTFAWLGGFRRLVVRWERKAQIYLAFLLIACILILLRAISG